MRIRLLGVRVLAGLFALLALADLWQLAEAVRGRHPDPPSLLALHALTAALAAGAAGASWQGRRWAAELAVAWTVATAGMLLALGPLLAAPAAERRALTGVAAGVLVVGLMASAFLRRALRKDRERDPR